MSRTARAPESPSDRTRPRHRMLRRVMAALGVLVVVVATAVWVTYPGVGRLAYDATIAVETQLAGLESESVEVDGLRMAYYEGGPDDAETIVLLHGYSSDRFIWTRFVKNFTDDYHVIVPDLAGHGDTPFVAGADYSAPAQADRVAGLLDELDVERAHVIGNSMGGFVAATLARTHPDRVLTLGLIDAAGVTSPEPSDLERMREQSNSNPFLFTDPADYDDFYAMTMANPPFVPGFVRDALAQEQAERRDELAEIYQDFAGQDLLDDHLDEITAPTLVMWGEEDRLVDPTAADVWMAGLPDASLVTYPGVGHLPMLEIADRSAEDYRKFLAAHMS